MSVLKKPFYSDWTAAGILKACSSYIPVNAPVLLAIEAHKRATRKPSTSAAERDVAEYTLRAIILAAAINVRQMQRQLDYLSALPRTAWPSAEDRSAAEVRKTTLAGFKRGIAYCSEN